MGKRKIFLLGAFIILLACAILGFSLASMWDKPLGPQLDLPTRTPSPVAPQIISSSAEQTVAPDELVISPQTTPSAQPTATKAPLCGGPPSMTILAIGSDQRGTGYMYGLADSIHIMYIDFVTPKIMVIDFPRDLWVEFPGISDHYGITHGKLNQAYLFGNPGMGYYDGPGEGPGLMARTLDLNFGLRVDHYVAIDTQTFVSLIDAVGGVDVVVNSPIDLSYGVTNPGPEYFLPVGTHHLDGERAYTLATNRIPTTFQRMKYQKIILSSLREKMLSPEMLPKIPQLAAEFIPSVQTDFTMNDIESLICIARAVPVSNIQAESLPQDMFTSGSIYDPYREVYTFVYQADFELIRSMMLDFTSGTWPIP